MNARCLKLLRFEVTHYAATGNGYNRDFSVPNALWTLCSLTKLLCPLSHPFLSICPLRSLLKRWLGLPKFLSRITVSLKTSTSPLPVGYVQIGSAFINTSRCPTKQKAIASLWAILLVFSTTWSKGDPPPQHPLFLHPILRLREGGWLTPWFSEEVPALGFIWLPRLSLPNALGCFSRICIEGFSNSRRECVYAPWGPGA